MVNYLYELDEVIADHEGFVGGGHVAMSRALQREQKKLAAAWISAAVPA